MTWGEVSEKRDPQWLYKEQTIGNLKYIGRSKVQDAADDDEVWEIERRSFSGSVETREFASGAINTLRWDLRTTYFGAVVFGNDIATTFDGVNERAVAPDNASLDVTDELSVFLWVKFTSTTAMFAAGKWSNSGSNRSWAIGSDNLATGKLRVLLSNSGASAQKDYHSTTVINDNAWHFVGFTFSGGVLKLYIDGVEETTTKIADIAVPTLLSGNAALTIGCINNAVGGNNFWNGLIDEVGIWDTAILTAAEIAELYGAGSPIDLNTDQGSYASSGDLVSWWRCGDGDTFPTMTDNHPTNTNNAAMTNMEASDFVTDAP